MIVLTNIQYAVLRWARGDDSGIHKYRKEDLAIELGALQEWGLVRRVPDFSYELTQAGYRMLGMREPNG